MSNLAIFAAATWVAVLMLFLSVRSLTWHKVSRLLNSLLLLLVLLATGLLVTHAGPVSFEGGLLFALCGLLGLAVGFARGQAAQMHYEPREGDVMCRRPALLIFCWAGVVIAQITLLADPAARLPSWEIALHAALIFLTASFITSTFTIFYRVSSLRREYLFQLEQEQLAQ